MQKLGWWTRHERATSLMDSRCLLMAPTARETTWVDGRPWAEPFHDGLGWWAWCQGYWGRWEAQGSWAFTSSWTDTFWKQYWRSEMAQTVDIFCCDTSFESHVYQLDPVVPGELGSWAEYSTCTVWSPQPGFIFLLRDLCSRWARLWWSPVASRTVSTDRKFGSLCWIQTFSSLSSSNQSVGLWGCVLYALGFKSEIEKKIRFFHRKNILDHDLKFYDFKLPTFQIYSSRLQWWVSLRRNKHIWNVSLKKSSPVSNKKGFSL